MASEERKDRKLLREAREEWPDLAFASAEYGHVWAQTSVEHGEFRMPVLVHVLRRRQRGLSREVRIEPVIGSDGPSGVVVGRGPTVRSARGAVALAAAATLFETPAEETRS